jgi:DNA-binding MarR family transcriptional regulator
VVEDNRLNLFDTEKILEGDETDERDDLLVKQKLNTKHIKNLEQKESLKNVFRWQSI